MSCAVDGRHQSNPNTSSRRVECAMVAHFDWRSLMARCTTCMRQPGKPVSADTRNPGSIVAHVLRADDHSTAVPTKSLFMESTHLTFAWGERVESLNAARGTQHSSIREFTSHTTIQAMSCLEDLVGREPRHAFEAHFNHGNGHARGGMDSGSVVRRQADARRRATTAVTEPNHAAPHRARCESFFTSSCPATPSSAVAGAFPPRSPGGRRSARGFSPSLSGDGNRGGNINSGDTVASGGTARRRLLVGERAAPGVGCSLASEAGVRADTWPAFDRMSQCGMGLNLDSSPYEPCVREKDYSLIREGASGESAQAA